MFLSSTVHVNLFSYIISHFYYFFASGSQDNIMVSLGLHTKCRLCQLTGDCQSYPECELTWSTRLSTISISVSNTFYTPETCNNEFTLIYYTGDQINGIETTTTTTVTTTQPTTTTAAISKSSCYNKKKDGFKRNITFIWTSLSR